MTIHKSQGSEFTSVVVVLPREGSPLLTRELVYTGMTRARDHLTLVADEAALRAAIACPARRSTGLGDRLGSSAPAGDRDADRVGRPSTRPPGAGGR
jgi:exodeoxyribonuclease V alpha subunit